MQSMLVSHGTRLRHLTMNERERLESIAQRARNISNGGARPEYARLYADVLTLLRIIGGEYAEGQENLL